MHIIRPQIHLADFHNTYAIPEDLDIVEMRAIWFNLPGRKQSVGDICEWIASDFLNFVLFDFYLFTGWEELPDEENANRADITPNSVYSMQVND